MICISMTAAKQQRASDVIQRRARAVRLVRFDMPAKVSAGG